MLRRAVTREILGSRRTVRVLPPEDITGLKVQAIANNPSKRPADLADIEAWMQLDGARLAWDRIREYFDLFGFLDLCAEMKSRCAHNAFIGHVRREFRPIVDCVMKPQGRRS